MKKFFKKNIGKIICAVCPECGYVENYIKDFITTNPIENYDYKKVALEIAMKE